MFTELRKITKVLSRNREEARNCLVTVDRKSNGLIAEALTSANTPIRNHSGGEWKDRGESRVGRNRPKTPYHLREGN